MSNELNDKMNFVINHIVESPAFYGMFMDKLRRILILEGQKKGIKEMAEGLRENIKEDDNDTNN